MKKRLHHFLSQLGMIDSAIGVLGVLFILCAAFVMQLVFHEAPCPLCLLQRAGFASVGLAFLMNLRYGNRVAHWALAILSACAGIAVSIRQILLHITSPVGFGSAILGLHMYTWCFIAFAVTIVGSAMMLIIYPEQNGRNAQSRE